VRKQVVFDLLKCDLELDQASVAGRRCGPYLGQQLIQPSHRFPVELVIPPDSGQDLRSGVPSAVLPEEEPRLLSNRVDEGSLQPVLSPWHNPSGSNQMFRQISRTSVSNKHSGR
jgi:hypothetical protein